MRKLGALSMVLVLAACGSDQTSAPPGNPGKMDQMIPDPPAGGQQLLSDVYSIDPGQEKYFCYTFHSPAEAEKAITQVLPAYGKLVHHSALFQTMSPEPEGFFECPTLIKTSWQPIWAGGRNTNGITLPQGVGFKIPANTQYLLQLHLFNTTTAKASERTAINLAYATDSSTLTGAGIFAFGTFSLTIPKGTLGYQKVIDCNVDRDMHVFAAFPHMHQLGTKISLEKGTTMAQAADIYHKDPWVFGDQPMDPVDVMVHQGDYMRATCTWDNMTGADVTFGESTTNEMCFMILFYYPFTDLDGCIQ
jgi:hypothetical protein